MFPEPQRATGVSPNQSILHPRAALSRPGASQPMRSIVVVLVAALLAACGGDSATGANLVAVVEITATPDTNRLAPGDSVQLTATPRDANGRALSVPVTFSSTNTAILTVTSSGLVTGKSVGFATINATAGNKPGKRDFEVFRPRSGTVAVSPDPAAVAPGETKVLTATVYDPDGKLVVDPSLTWKSSDESKATITPVPGTNTATLTGVASGSATITAVARTDTGRATVAVTTSASPQITGIAPSPLVPGGTGTITGTGFSGTPSSNLVTVDGVAATVTAATPTQLTIALPASGFACNATRNVGVLVQVGSDANVTSHPLQVATQRSLDVGGSFRVDAQSAVRCNELTTPGRYLISVYNTSTAVGIADFNFRGAASTVAGDVATPALATAPSLSFAQSALVQRPVMSKAGGELDVRTLRRRAAAHAQVLEANRRFAERQMRAGRRPVAALSVSGAPASGSAPIRVSTTIGTVNSVRVPNLDESNFCNQYFSIGARTAYVGTNSIILEDTANTTAGTMDSYFQEVGQEFDTDMWNVLTTYFGDPLAMDTELSRTGKVVMVFSERVNNIQRGVLGYVVSCDFFPRADSIQNNASNEGEYFYARAATSTTRGFDQSFNPDEWKREMRGTLIHEAKHIVSFGTRIANNAEEFEDQWLEEATAMHAEEIWARTVYPNAWKDNSQYDNTLYFDVRPSSGKPFVVFNHYAFLYDYLSDVENGSPLGESAGDQTSNFYGSGWSLVRWAADNYATDEAAFFKALTQERSLAGADNLAARAGRPFGVLLGDWSLALVADDYPAPSEPDSALVPDSTQLRIPSWDTRDIFADMSSESFQGDPFPRAFPASPRQVSYGTFNVDARARSGSMSYFELSGTMTGSKQLLEVRSLGGNDPAPSLRIAVVRVQ